MIKKLVLVIVFLTSISAISQIKFETGYFISNKGEKINCFIRNVDWRNNPSSFKYRLEVDSEIKTANLETISAFEINEQLRYERYSIPVDRSKPNLTNLSTIRAPEYLDEVLFLKVLLKGSASLYQYIDGDIIRYYYSLDSEKVIPLVHKKYKNSNGRVAENNAYKQQLNLVLPIAGNTVEQLNQILYEAKPLAAYFRAYNTADKSVFVDYNKKQEKKGLFRLSIRPGVTLNSFAIAVNNSQESLPPAVDFGANLSFRLGAEFEYIFPFNKNKWSLIIEAIYKTYTVEATTLDGLSTASLDYVSVEIPLGVRHYLFLNEQSKLFVNGQFNFVLVPGTQVEFGDRENLDVGRGLGANFGVGYNYKNTFSLELRYNTYQDILLGAPFSTIGTYNGISFIVGYRLL